MPNFIIFYPFDFTRVYLEESQFKNHLLRHNKFDLLKEGGSQFITRTPILDLILETLKIGLWEPNRKTDGWFVSAHYDVPIGITSRGGISCHIVHVHIDRYGFVRTSFPYPCGQNCTETHASWKCVENHIPWKSRDG